MEQRPIVLLDIGNTHCRQALAVGDDIREVSCIPTDAFLESQARVGLLAALPEAPAAVACVVPEARRVCRESFPTRKMFFLSADTVDRPDFSSVDTSTIGADRVANAVAAVHTAGTPVVVADAGTALTTEAVDAAGRFRGGAIAPTLRTPFEQASTEDSWLPFATSSRPPDAPSVHRTAPYWSPAATPLFVSNTSRIGCPGYEPLLQTLRCGGSRLRRAPVSK